MSGKEVVDADDVAIDSDTGITVLHVELQLLLDSAIVAQRDGSHHHILRAWRILTGTLDDVLSRMLLNLLTTDGRVGLADAGIEQTQVFVDLGGGTNGRTRIARDDFLFDGDSGWNALDEVALRLVHTTQELAGIRRETLYIATLTFSIKGIKGQ